MRVSWEDVGGTGKPGIYIVHGVQVHVNSSDIADWKKNPGLTFGLKHAPSMEHPNRYILVDPR